MDLASGVHEFCFLHHPLTLHLFQAVVLSPLLHLPLPFPLPLLCPLPLPMWRQAFLHCYLAQRKQEKGMSNPSSHSCGLFTPAELQIPLPLSRGPFGSDPSSCTVCSGHEVYSSPFGGSSQPTVSTLVLLLNVTLYLIFIFYTFAWIWR